jgi:hypothetical protein
VRQLSTKITKSIITFSVAILLLLGFYMEINLAEANPIVFAPNILINGDGSITAINVNGTSMSTPDFIKKNGNKYYLTSDVEHYSFVIRCSNIIFDGQGHTIYGTNGGNNAVGIGYDQVGLLINRVTNVTIKDVIINNFGYSNIELDACSYCTFLRVQTIGQPFEIIDGEQNSITYCALDDLELIGESSNNVIEKNQLGTLYLGGHDNTITKNSVTSYLFDGLSHNNLIYYNNFLVTINPIDFRNVNFWDNGQMGNYWSNYPLGNAPYIINSNNQDNYPLNSPIPIESAPTPEPTEREKDTTQLSNTSYSTVAILLSGVIAGTVIVCVALLIVYRKHSLKKRVNGDKADN